MFEHLKLSRWPFVVVPEPALCTFLADRHQFTKDIEALLRNLSRQNASSIHLLWSWFGAGKTHGLYYISNRAKQIQESGQCNLVTIYSEFPLNPRSFVDVYRSLALNLDSEELIHAYLEICTSISAHILEKELRQTSPDLFAALKVLSIGEPSDQDLVMRWIRAEPIPIADCRRVGISKKISSTEDASRLLIAILRMFGLCANSKNYSNSRVLWLLDELQRIDQLPARIRNEINTAIHSVFNARPTGFSILLSFSGQPTDRLPDWFSPELKDRMGPTKVLVLPPMEMLDALTFVRDILTYSRTQEEFIDDPYFPFSEHTCKILIQGIKDRGELKPRSIMQVFGSVLSEADPEIESGDIVVISPEFAMSVLSELVELD